MVAWLNSLSWFFVFVFSHIPVGSPTPPYPYIVVTTANSRDPKYLWNIRKAYFGGWANHIITKVLYSVRQQCDITAGFSGSAPEIIDSRNIRGDDSTATGVRRIFKEPSASSFLPSPPEPYEAMCFFCRVANSLLLCFVTKFFTRS